MENCCPDDLGLPCEEFCGILFPELKLFECPCHIYGDKAFDKVEELLIKDGWIEKED